MMRPTPQSLFTIDDVEDANAREVKENADRGFLFWLRPGIEPSLSTISRMPSPPTRPTSGRGREERSLKRQVRQARAAWIKRTGL
jgi:hypothetical protein